MAVKAQLCQRCRDVLERPFEKPQRSWDSTEHPHHESLESLEAASAAGCPICLWLLTMFNKHKGNVPLTLCHSEDYGTIPMTTLYHRASSKRIREGYELPTTQAHFICPLQEFSGEVLENVSVCAVLQEMSSDLKLSGVVAFGYTGSEQTLSLAKDWLERCNSYHQCFAPGQNDWRPTRLVMISRNPDGTYDTCIGDAGQGAFSAGVKYVALSHRWLHDDPVRLTATTRQEFEQRLPFQDLKATIKDAVDATYRLGLRHIWIDSLCIVQDDDDDKAKEIIMMDQIYSNAYLTISAAFSERLDEGIYSKRDNRMITEYRVELSQAGDITKEYSLRLGHDTVSQDGPDYCMLSQRAWCFQERLLSHRKLYFDEGQVYWECRALEASETSPEGFVDSIPGSPEHERSLATRVLSAFSNDGKSGSHQFAKVWKEIVQTYTYLNMSFSGDRLHALAGIAKWCEGVSKDEYLFGLWRSRLPFNLMWNIQRHNLDHPAKRSDGVAPTWSWGSVQGPCLNADPDFIGNGEEERRPAVQVEYIPDFKLIRTSRQNNRPPDTTRAPVMRLKGRPYKASVHLDNITNPQSGLRLDVPPTEWICSPSIAHILEPVNVSIHVDDRDSEQFPIDVTALPCVEHGHLGMRALLLVRDESFIAVEDPNIPVFRRIGTFGTFTMKDGPTFRDVLDLSTEQTLILR